MRHEINDAMAMSKVRDLIRYLWLQDLKRCRDARTSGQCAPRGDHRE